MFGGAFKLNHPSNFSDKVYRFDVTDSDTTFIPTFIPSIIPTNNPTINPSISPSQLPTHVPTNLPTDTPTTPVSTSNNISTTGHNTPTTAIASTTQLVGSSTTPGPTLSGNSDAERRQYNPLIKNLDQLAQMIVGICFVALIITIIISFATHLSIGKRYGCDNPKYSTLLRFVQECGDYWTDIIFVIIVFVDKRLDNNIRQVLFFVSLIFLIVPYCLSCGVAFYWIEKWNNLSLTMQNTNSKDDNDNDNPNRLKHYLAKYQTVLWLFTIVANFFVAVDLITGKVFVHDLFYFSLKTKEIEMLRYWKFIVVILLEVRVYVSSSDLFDLWSYVHAS